MRSTASTSCIRVESESKERSRRAMTKRSSASRSRKCGAPKLGLCRQLCSGSYSHRRSSLFTGLGGHSRERTGLGARRRFELLSTDTQRRPLIVNDRSLAAPDEGLLHPLCLSSWVYGTTRLEVRRATPMHDCAIGSASQLALRLSEGSADVRRLSGAVRSPGAA